MLGAGSHEEKVSRLEGLPLAVMKENTPALDHHVHFVLCMRGRWTRKRGVASESEHGVHRSAPQKADRVLARRTWNVLTSLGKPDHAATVGRIHASQGYPAETCGAARPRPRMRPPRTHRST